MFLRLTFLCSTSLAGGSLPFWFLILTRTAVEAKLILWHLRRVVWEPLRSSRMLLHND